MWHIYTMECYSAIKNDEFVSFLGTWMNLENIILSKLTQEQKMKYCIFSLIGGMMNNENTWTQGREHYTLGSIGGNRGGTAGGELGRDSLGRNAKCGRRGGRQQNTAMCVPMQLPCMFCTCTPKPKMQLKKKKLVTFGWGLLSGQPFC